MLFSRKLATQFRISRCHKHCEHGPHSTLSILSLHNILSRDEKFIENATSNRKFEGKLEGQFQSFHACELEHSISESWYKLKIAFQLYSFQWKNERNGMKNVGRVNCRSCSQFPCDYLTHNIALCQKSRCKMQQKLPRGTWQHCWNRPIYACSECQRFSLGFPFHSVNMKYARNFVWEHELRSFWGMTRWFVRLFTGREPNFSPNFIQKDNPSLQ
jgi:hypothetical protein